MNEFWTGVFVGIAITFAISGVTTAIFIQCFRDEIRDDDEQAR